jgi:hypothetical protein
MVFEWEALRRLNQVLAGANERYTDKELRLLIEFFELINAEEVGE